MKSLDWSDLPQNSFESFSDFRSSQGALRKLPRKRAEKRLKIRIVPRILFQWQITLFCRRRAFKL